MATDKVRTHLSSVKPLSTTDIYEAAYVAASGHAIELVPSPDGDGFFAFRFGVQAADSVAAFRQDDVIQSFVRAERRLRQRLGAAKREAVRG